VRSALLVPLAVVAALLIGPIGLGKLAAPALSEPPLPLFWRRGLTEFKKVLDF
jgi:hypothetical protein